MLALYRGQAHLDHVSQGRGIALFLAQLAAQFICDCSREFAAARKRNQRRPM